MRLPKVNRRRFMKQVGSLFAVSTSFNRMLTPFAGAQSLKAAKSADPEQTPSSLVKGAYSLLPLGSIRAEGWLRDQLQIQARGLGGHLDEVWPDVGSQSGWLGGSGESWERGPYFLDGLVPLAWQLDDPVLKAKAQRFVDWTLEHQAPNGMIGPASNDDWWPRIVMLKALSQYQELSGDERVIPLMDRYFRYQLAELPSRPLKDWGKFRWQDEVISVLWLYERTNSAYLLKLAQLLHTQGYDWMAQYADFKYTERVTADSLKLEQGEGLKDPALSIHGVNNAQAVKTGAVWSRVSGAETDKAAVLKMISELDRYHGLPNGMFSCDEHLAGRDPSQGSELCSVVEYMYSLEQAIAIVGEAAFGDRLEKLAFNALPGTFTDDMWAHQYNQEPNQVECSLHHKPWTTDGPESNLYGLAPNFGCCTANFHQGWPKFTASLWMKPESGGLAAMVYAPCQLKTRIGSTEVAVVEETSYPFKGNIKIRIDPASPIELPLSLRIPGWASGAEVRVNGELLAGVVPGEFFRVRRQWQHADRVEIEFPMAPRISTWYRKSIAIERGPLVFSLPIGTDWLKLTDRGKASDWQVYPATPWNYGLAVDAQTVESAIRVDESSADAGVFTLAHTPVRLEVPAVMIPTWRAQDGVADPVPESPVLEHAGGPVERIQLVPYSAAKLRITAFPQVPVTLAHQKS